MSRSFVRPALIAAGVLCASIATASVTQLTLRQMLERADSAVLGTVTARNSWHGEHPGFQGGADFTTLTVEGEDLVQGKTVTREITYLGSDAWPVSEMPSFADTKVGVRGVFFSQAVGAPWGGRAGLNTLITAQNGVFRIESGPKGDVVLGKGEGSAISANTFATDVRKQVSAELAAIRASKK